MRELVVKVDVGEECERLRERLREVEMERDVWKGRVEKVEERVGMFERVREWVRRVREVGGEGEGVGVLDGVDDFMEECYIGGYDEVGGWE